MGMIPPGLQRFALAVVAAVILGTWGFRPAGRAVTAHSREIAAVLHGTAAALSVAAAAFLLLYAARTVLAHRGEHHLPPPVIPEPVPQPHPAEPEVRMPARPGQPAYTYRLRPEGSTARETETVGAQPWPDRENL